MTHINTPIQATDKCRGPNCGAPIAWHWTGRRHPTTQRKIFQPVNPDGTPHHSTCPDVAMFRRKR